MRVAAFGLIVVFLLGAIWLASAGDGPVRAQQPHVPLPAAISSRPAMASAGDWMAFCSDTGEGPTQITLIDTKLRVLSVYHIDRVKGTIELMSVRKLEQDLRMEEYNGMRPLPKEIRDLLEQR